MKPPGFLPNGSLPVREALYSFFSPHLLILDIILRKNFTTFGKNISAAILEDTNTN